jgi:hypothetical protein
MLEKDYLQLEKDYLQLYNLYNKNNTNLKDFCMSRVYRFIASTYIIEVIMGIFLYKVFRYFIF